MTGERLMKKVSLALTIPIVFIGGFLVGAKAEQNKKHQSDADYIRLFMDVFEITKQNYVVNPSTKKMIYGALNGMLQSLDPFSDFFTPSEFKEFTQDTEGQFGGIGIEIARKDGRPIVIAPIEGTPAYKAGMRAGDIIIKINGKDTSGMSLFKIIKLIKGKPGTTVTLTVFRKGVDHPLTFKLTREIIKVPAVKAAMVDNHIGYIKLVQFQENAYSELAKAVKKLESKGANEFIFDLRNDPGGLLTQAIKVGNVFLPKGKLVVYTKGRVVGEHKYYTKHNPLIPMQDKVVVLVNGGTASAAEIVTGALKYYKRATVIGEKTFGKGSVQNLIPLENGAGLKLTIAYWYTPAGIFINKKGIMPDILIKFPAKEQEELVKTIEDMRLKGDNQKVILLPNKDPQLKAAIDYLEGKPVKSEEEKPKKKAS
jgi:carboxyl-terminal processing protease